MGQVTDEQIEASNQGMGSSLRARLVHVASVACLVLALLSLCAPWLWIGNLLNHISAHVLLLSLILVPLVKRQASSSACLMLALCLWSWPWVYQAYEERAPEITVESTTDASLFFTANTAWWNQEDPELIAERIVAIDADFCVLAEVHPDLAKILRKNPKPKITSPPMLSPNRSTNHPGVRGR